MSTIEVERWVANRDDADPSRNLLVLPGMAYPIGMPLLFLPAIALTDQGWTVWHATWDLRDVAGDGALFDAVNDTLRQLVMQSGGSCLVLGKSVGTLGAQAAAQLDLPAVWLTPLMREPSIADDIAASSSDALLVGGTADPSWDAALARGTEKAVLEIAGADHGLYADGWRRYLRDLESVTGAIVDFAAAVG